MLQLIVHSYWQMKISLPFFEKKCFFANHQSTGSAGQHNMSVSMFRNQTMALFIWLIIRLIQLVFSVGTVFFSHKKSVNSVFQPAYNSSRTGPILDQIPILL
jgi:hypothetical protein